MNQRLGSRMSKLMDYIMGPVWIVIGVLNLVNNDGWFWIFAVLAGILFSITPYYNLFKRWRRGEGEG